MPGFINFHVDLEEFTTPRLKKILTEKESLSASSYSKIRDELLRRDGYYRD